ncbi:helix-turn-helix domain-containing protein [Roseovarius sp.]|uniref:helix-turn-helix domain-containing protein n=1 Tax=Roseovarius sp. TaxID=1486281 RepID=UPI003D12DF7B
MFADVIEKSGRTRREWATDLGVSPGFLSDLLNGNRVPSLKLAVRIERLTEGAVPCNSWVPDTKGAAA